jgi:dipeptidyl aminopeptidase/acylaminoacyl peptidase
MRQIFIGLALAVMLATLAGAKVDHLPDVIGFSEHVHQAPSAKWTIRQIVELRELKETAVCENRDIAFILKQSFIDQNEVRYAVYVIRHGGDGSARKFAEASFIADIACHPKTKNWTVRADFGSGVQLYDLNGPGKHGALLNNQQMVIEGAYEGIVTLDAPHSVGVFSYRWSPDGSRLWYSRPVRRSALDTSALLDGGITFDDVTMDYLWFRHVPALAGHELHVLDVTHLLDRKISFLAADGDYNNYIFRFATISWSNDSKHIVYLKPIVRGGQTSGIDFALEEVDVASGSSKTLTRKGSPFEIFQMFQISGDSGYLTVRREGDERKLLAITTDGTVTKDFGSVQFSTILQSFAGRQDNRFVLDARLPDRDGLFFYPESPQKVMLSQVPDDLSQCSFTDDLHFGSCVRQGLAVAPEIVAIYPDQGNMVTVARPNASYDDLVPLRTERLQWQNKFGEPFNGYIIYPRGYIKGHAYPVVCITHGYDARNKFAGEDLQWEYPIQVLAERGYLILAVNEPPISAKTSAAYDAWVSRETTVEVAKMQYAAGFNAVAAMEAALQWTIEKGLADRNRTSIVGYSRGSVVVNLVMTQSKMFAVGSSGEGAIFNAGGYWDWGSASMRGMYRSIFGGSPYDESVQENYRRFSPSFRIKQISGPLLQQDASSTGPAALELYELLQESGVPTELVFYDHESHVFYQPRHRKSAMELNLNWLNYWLLNQRSSDPAMKALYEHWDEMARRWNARKVVSEKTARQ